MLRPSPPVDEGPSARIVGILLVLSVLALLCLFVLYGFPLAEFGTTSLAR